MTADRRLLLLTALFAASAFLVGNVLAARSSTSGPAATKTTVSLPCVGVKSAYLSQCKKAQSACLALASTSPTSETTCLEGLGVSMKALGEYLSATATTGTKTASASVSSKAPVGEASPGPAVSPDELKSPNGMYSIGVSNSGITIEGPDGSILLDNQGIHIKSATNLDLTAGQNVDLEGEQEVTVEGGVQVAMKTAGNNVTVSPAGDAIQGTSVTLACAAGQGAPVARVGDKVSGGVISSGSPTVLSC